MSGLLRWFYRRDRRAGEAAPAGAALLAAVLAAPVAGCGVTFDLPPLAGSKADATGSLASQAVSPLSSELGEEDWRRARGALAIALDPQGNGSAVSWDNPESGLRGSFTPVGQPFVKSDEICRAFLASVSGQASTSQLQGTACRPSGSDWMIKEVRPWRKPL